MKYRIYNFRCLLLKAFLDNPDYFVIWFFFNNFEIHIEYRGYENRFNEMCLFNDSRRFNN